MFPFGQFPFKKYMEHFSNQTNTNNVDEYVQKMMSDAFSNAFPNFSKNSDNPHSSHESSFFASSMPSKLTTHIFETLDECIVQVKIPDKSILEHVKVFHSPHECIIECLADKPFKEVLLLPCSVKRKGTKAVYRDGILEIRLLKRSEMPISEVNIQNLD